MLRSGPSAGGIWADLGANFQTAFVLKVMIVMYVTEHSKRNFMSSMHIGIVVCTYPNRSTTFRYKRR